MILLAIALLASLAQDRVGDPPRALEALIDARLSLRRADVLWGTSMIYNSRPDEPFYHRSLIGRDSAAGWVLGYADAVTGADTEGKPVSRRFGELKTAEAHWRHDLDATTAEGVYGDDLPPCSVNDVRTLGFFPGINHRAIGSLNDALEHLNKDGKSVSYASRVEEQIHIVDLFLDDELAVRWHLDERQGWNATKIEGFAAGKLSSVAVVALAQFDGVWFPQIVTYFEPQRGPEPVGVIHVEQASLNASDLPDHLSLSHIGVEPGMFLSITGLPGYPGGAFWSGERIVTAEEYAELRSAGNVTDGPTVRAFFERQEQIQSTQPAPPPWTPADFFAGVDLKAFVAGGFETDWRRYTRMFIQKYKLDVEQTQKAYSILRQCEERAAAEFRKIEPRILEIEKAAKGLTDAAEGHRLAQRAVDLRLPIESIFETSLKPRLARLPTRAQRLGADGVTSRPAGVP